MTKPRRRPKILGDIEAAASEALNRVRGVMWVGPATVDGTDSPTYVTITVELDAFAGPEVREWLASQNCQCGGKR